MLWGVAHFQVQILRQWVGIYGSPFRTEQVLSLVPEGGGGGGEADSIFCLLFSPLPKLFFLLNSLIWCLCQPVDHIPSLKVNPPFFVLLILWLLSLGAKSLWCITYLSWLPPSLSSWPPQICGCRRWTWVGATASSLVSLSSCPQGKHLHLAFRLSLIINSGQWRIRVVVYVCLSGLKWLSAGKFSQTASFSS